MMMIMAINDGGGDGSVDDCGAIQPQLHRILKMIKTWLNNSKTPTPTLTHLTVFFIQ